MSSDRAGEEFLIAELGIPGYKPSKFVTRAVGNISIGYRFHDAAVGEEIHLMLFDFKVGYVSGWFASRKIV